MLRQVVTKTFNRITVDGDTSTNDTCVVLANGLAGNPAITGPGRRTTTFSLPALRHVCEYDGQDDRQRRRGRRPAHHLHRDGGRRPRSRPSSMAKAVVRSPLVKCAIFGTDANWGRVLCAMGYSGAQF